MSSGLVARAPCLWNRSRAVRIIRKRVSAPLTNRVFIDSFPVYLQVQKGLRSALATDHGSIFVLYLFSVSPSTINFLLCSGIGRTFRGFGRITRVAPRHCTGTFRQRVAGDPY